jgi:hypothetical protein
MAGPDRAAFQVCGAGKEAVGACESPPEGNSSGPSIGAHEEGNFWCISWNVAACF